MIALIVAAIVVTSISLFLMWLISWARTPLSSLSSSIDSIPCVHATTAFFGFGPVANAFGVLVGIMYSFGFGSLISFESSSIILCIWGCSFLVAGIALYIFSTSLCEKKYIPKFRAMARIAASVSPCIPNSSFPVAIISPDSAPNSSAVLIWFHMLLFSGCAYLIFVN